MQFRRSMGRKQAKQATCSWSVTGSQGRISEGYDSRGERRNAEAAARIWLNEADTGRLRRNHISGLVHKTESAVRLRAERHRLVIVPPRTALVSVGVNSPQRGASRARRGPFVQEQNVLAFEPARARALGQQKLIERSSVAPGCKKSSQRIAGCFFLHSIRVVRNRR